jgi:hypothetical protein
MSEGADGVGVGGGRLPLWTDVRLWPRTRTLAAPWRRRRRRRPRQGPSGVGGVTTKTAQVREAYGGGAVASNQAKAIPPRCLLTQSSTGRRRRWRRAPVQRVDDERAEIIIGPPNGFGPYNTPGSHLRQIDSRRLVLDSTARMTLNPARFLPFRSPRCQHSKWLPLLTKKWALTPSSHEAGAAPTRILNGP